jgi:hypothetical protein
MQTFTSEAAVVVVRNFTSGHANIAPFVHSASSEITVRRFSSLATEKARQIQISGGYLTWTVRKDNKDSVHASRVHGSLYGSVPPLHPWEDTKINQDDDNFIEASSGVVSPFYSSPSAYVNSNRELRVSAISQGLSVFSLSTNGFVEDVHNISSRNSPVSAKMASHADGEASSGYLLDSGNLYYEAGIAEET